MRKGRSKNAHVFGISIVENLTVVNRKRKFFRFVMKKVSARSPKLDKISLKSTTKGRNVKYSKGLRTATTTH